MNDHDFLTVGQREENIVGRLAFGYGDHPASEEQVPGSEFSLEFVLKTSCERLSQIWLLWGSPTLPEPRKPCRPPVGRPQEPSPLVSDLRRLVPVASPAAPSAHSQTFADGGALLIKSTSVWKPNLTGRKTSLIEGRTRGDDAGAPSRCRTSAGQMGTSQSLLPPGLASRRRATRRHSGSVDLPTLWPRLDMQTRDWLMAHNGEPLAPAVVDALTLANGGSTDTSWFSDHEDGVLTDEAVDWIEGVANDEDPTLD